MRQHHNKGRKHTPEHIAQTRRPMELNGRWRGGRMLDSDGYVLIKKREHPRASHLGYVREHRLVMEATLGRLLEPQELVHHVNGVKTDNRPENLMVVTHAEHMRIERVGKKFPRTTTQILTCERCGSEYHRAKSWGPSRYCGWACRYPSKENACAN